MKKYLLVGMVVALSLLTACGKKDFSKMTFNDGITQVQQMLFLQYKMEKL